MLYGRDGERQALHAVVERARSGSGGAIVVHGDAGVGKSSLLDAVGADATGMRVLRTKGVESESPLAFAALHRLLLPLLDRLDRLPPPQAQAIASVLGRHEGPSGDDRFLVFLGALGLIADAAEESPVLCLVDDAHWLDEASQAALLFVARRVELTPAAIVFGARDGGERRFEASDLPDLALHGIDAEAADALLTSPGTAQELDSEVRAELVRRVGGNPLALIEIARALTPAEAAGTAPLPRDLPLTERLERIFLAQIDRLGEEAARFLLLAAVDDTGDVAVLRRASAALAIDADAATMTAERAHVLAVGVDGVTFRHPLMRSAVLGAATTIDRRRAHAALAEALEAFADADRAVWHRAAAVHGPDEAIAVRLAEAAARARRVGGHEAASAASERAADLSGTAEARAARLADAAASAWSAGDSARTRDLADRVRATADDPARIVEVDRLRAFVEMNFGSPQRSRAIMLAASRVARDAGDPATARRLAMVAAAVGTFIPGPAGTADGAHGGSPSSPGGPDDAAGLALPSVDAERVDADACVAALLAGMHHVSQDAWLAAVAEFRQAMDLAERLDVPDLVTNIGIAAVHLGDDAAALRWHDRQLDEARDAASPLGTIHALTRRGWAQIATGQWGELEVAAAEVLDLARVLDHPNQRPLPLAQLLVVDAHRGAADVLERADAIEAELRRHPAGLVDGSVLDLLSWSRGVAAVRDLPEVAIEHLRSISIGPMQRLAVVDRLDAANRAGRLDLVEEVVGGLDGFATATGNGWALGAVAYGRALLATRTDEREASFVEALDRHAGSTTDGGVGRPLDAARVALAYGEFLRRERRRVDAREHLRSAIATFDRLGAAPWSARAAEELRASGETVRRRSGGDAASARPVLTAQELQVARLVKSGLSNREVAARLFVSPRTVEFHLRNVFEKLGISSRGGLATADLEIAA